MKKYFLILLLPLTALNSEEPASNPIHNLSIIVDHKRADVSFVNFTTAHALADIQNHMSAILISKALLERILIATELVKDPEKTLKKYPALAAFTQPADREQINFDGYFKKNTGFFSMVTDWWGKSKSTAMVKSFIEEAEQFRSWFDEAQTFLETEVEKTTPVEDIVKKMQPPPEPKNFKSNTAHDHEGLDFSPHWALYAAQFKESEWDIREVSQGFILLTPKNILAQNQYGLNLSDYPERTVANILEQFKHKEINEDPNTTLPSLAKDLFVSSKEYKDHPEQQPFWNIKAAGHGTPQDEATPEGSLIGVSIPAFTKFIKQLNNTYSVNQLFMTSCFASDINLVNAFSEPINKALSITLNFDVITDCFTYDTVVPQARNPLLQPSEDNINTIRKTLHLTRLIDFDKAFFTSAKQNPGKMLRAMAQKMSELESTERQYTSSFTFHYFRHIPTIRFKGTEQFFPIVKTSEGKLISPVFAITKTLTKAKAADEKPFIYSQKDFETFQNIDPNVTNPKPIGVYTLTVMPALLIQMNKENSAKSYQSKSPKIISQVPGDAFHYFEEIELSLLFTEDDYLYLASEDIDLSIFATTDFSPLKKEFFIKKFSFIQPKSGSTKTITDFYILPLIIDGHKHLNGREYFYKENGEVYRGEIFMYTGVEGNVVKEAEKLSEAPERYLKAIEKAEQRRTEALGEASSFKGILDVQKKKIKEAKKVSYKKSRRQKIRKISYKKPLRRRYRFA